jgi:hypothetical protein
VIRRSAIGSSIRARLDLFACKPFGENGIRTHQHGESASVVPLANERLQFRMFRQIMKCGRTNDIDTQFVVSRIFKCRTREFGGQASAPKSRRHLCMPDGHPSRSVYLEFQIRSLARFVDFESAQGSRGRSIRHAKEMQSRTLEIHSPRLLIEPYMGRGRAFMLAPRRVNFTYGGFHRLGPWLSGLLCLVRGSLRRARWHDPSNNMACIRRRLQTQVLERKISCRSADSNPRFR